MCMFVNGRLVAVTRPTNMYGILYECVIDDDALHVTIVASCIHSSIRSAYALSIEEDNNISVVAHESPGIRLSIYELI